MKQSSRFGDCFERNPSGSGDKAPRCVLQASGKNLNLNDESQHGLLMQLLKLSYNCLNYDFIGTSTDESSDDLCTVQIPTSWRSGNRGNGSGGGLQSRAIARSNTESGLLLRICNLLSLPLSLFCSVS